MVEYTEEWRVIPGWEMYQVSTRGRVRRNKLILKQHLNQRYMMVHLFNGTKSNGKRNERFVKVDVLILEAFVGPRPAIWYESCHKNGNRFHNCLCNLRWGTASSNVMDSVIHGTHLNTRKTHCPWNHPLVDPNLDASKKKQGRRVCRACTNTQVAQRRAMSLGKPFDYQSYADRALTRIMGASQSSPNKINQVG